jgi:hypothetical protein
MYVARLLASAALVAALPSCGGGDYGEGWDTEVCEGEALELVDRAIAEAIVVEPYVDSHLSYRFEGEYPEYSVILEQLLGARSGDRIRCGRPLEEAPHKSGAFATSDGGIVLNTDEETWNNSLESWQAGQEYGTLSASEVEAAIAGMEYDEFEQLTAIAWDYLVGPAGVTEMLVHEAVHLATPDCCHHEAGVPRDCDFVDAVGQLAAHGVYWERWVDEGQWLHEVYWKTRSE